MLRGLYLQGVPELCGIPTSEQDMRRRLFRGVAHITNGGVHYSFSQQIRLALNSPLRK
jgi:hypothetical protein